MKHLDCELCGKPTSFERHGVSESAEGDRCILCDSWICPECVAWKMSSDNGAVCRDCNLEN